MRHIGRRHYLDLEWELARQQARAEVWTPIFFGFITLSGLMALVATIVILTR